MDTNRAQQAQGACYHDLERNKEPMNSPDLITSHYDYEYFYRSQRANGEIGGRANLFKFQPYIKSSDDVLDFGCGGGFLLNNLSCATKTGVELNPHARRYCEENHGIKVHASLDDVEDGRFDVVISNHCIEHVKDPYQTIEKLKAKLRPGGRIVICVPIDSYSYRWAPNDVCNHLYSFSPMNLGNILQGAGFTGIESRALLHKWVPKYRVVIRLFGFKVFHWLSYVYGNFIYNTLPIRRKTKWNQVLATGLKKA
ncbi:MAG: class I SAM-dependent methyltransferase [Proteobacteria bacterium]|nr:class I SAM-dependent methyltransferase [Pseudomonadota bacterium]